MTKHGDLQAEQTIFCLCTCLHTRGRALYKVQKLACKPDPTKPYSKGPARSMSPACHKSKVPMQWSTLL